MPETTGQNRSHSQLSKWLECGRAYQLARILNVPSRAGVWLPAGTAVHASVERYLRATLKGEA